MSFSGDYITNQLYDTFNFFVTGGEDGAISESLDISYTKKLNEIRVHCSVVFASDEYLRVQISNTQGSAYNFILLSYAMSDIQDLLWQPDQPIFLDSTDQLVFSLSMVSGTNVIGLNAVGWAAVGA